MGLKSTYNLVIFHYPQWLIHAVHTPQDSIVIGGNYLTIRDMVMQLKINEIERETKVPTKFRFPMFNKVLWLTAWYYYNHQNEFQSDISEDEDGNAILTRLIGHLVRTFRAKQNKCNSKRSIPKAIGKPMVFINKLLAWKRGFVWCSRVSIVLRLVLASCDCVAYK